MQLPKQPPSIIIRSLFWIWTLLFYGVVISQCLALSSRSYGEQKLAMILAAGFLLLVYTGIYLSIAINNLLTKYFSKWELVFWVGSLLLAAIFMNALRNNAEIPIVY